MNDRLLIFDLDGTLVDSAPDIAAAMNDVLKRRGRDPLPVNRIRQAIGHGVKQLVTHLIPDAFGENLSPKDIDLELDNMAREFFEYYETNLLAQTKLYDGVISFLENCPMKIAIVTNKPKHLTAKTIEGTALKRFPWIKILSGDSLTESKPHPMPLLACVEAAGVIKENTFMIGDGLPDIEAANRAGMRSIAHLNGYSDISELNALRPTASFKCYSELERILASFN